VLRRPIEGVLPELVFAGPDRVVAAASDDGEGDGQEGEGVFVAAGSIG
jgi:hypothetical protein